MKKQPIIYVTGLAVRDLEWNEDGSLAEDKLLQAYFEGTPLVGGCWTLYRQFGFPLEMSAMFLKDQGGAIDWLEVLADASRYDEMPRVMDKIESGECLDGGPPSVEELKLRFCALFLGDNPPFTYDSFLERKRKSGTNCEAILEKLKEELMLANPALKDRHEAYVKNLKEALNARS